MKVKAETVTTPMRRVTIELPVDRAEALARVLMNELVWDETEAGEELADLYTALARGENTNEENA